MKRISLTAVIALVVVSFIAGCKKDDDTTTATVVGFWSGTTASPDGIGFLLRSNGSMRAYLASADTSLADKYEGTYTESSDSLRMHFGDGFFQRSAAAKVNAAKNSMNGTLGVGNSTAGSNTFTATK
jgi:hypothetical protein